MVAFGLLSPAEGAVADAFGNQPGEEHDDEDADQGRNAIYGISAKLAKGAVEPLSNVDGDGRLVDGGLEFVGPAIGEVGEREAEVLSVLSRHAHYRSIVGGEVDEVGVFDGGGADGDFAFCIFDEAGDAAVDDGGALRGGNIVEAADLKEGLTTGDHVCKVVGGAGGEFGGAGFASWLLGGLLGGLLDGGFGSGVGDVLGVGDRCWESGGEECGKTEGSAKGSDAIGVKGGLSHGLALGATDVMILLVLQIGYLQMGWV